MNKAVIIAIHPKWMRMIENGEKEFEFRDYAIPKGTKVYLYESKGKKRDIDLWEKYPEYFCWRENDGQGKMLNYITQGKGAVVAEFVVGECYELAINGCGEEHCDDCNLMDDYLNCKALDNDYYDKMIDILRFYNQGYTNQKYAHKIENLIVYDANWQKEHWEYYNEKEVPTKPIPVTEFIGWNKLQKLTAKRNEEEDVLRAIAYGYTSLVYTMEEYLRESISYDDNDCYLSHPPQGKIYVVEREE